LSITNLFAKLIVRDIENDPKFKDLKKQYNETLEHQRQIKKLDPYANTPELMEYEAFHNYEKRIKPFLMLYNLTGIIYAILFFGSFIFYCSSLKEAFLITIGSFIVSIGCIISPMWKISGIIMLDEDYSDPLSIFRFAVSVFIFFFGIIIFSLSWLVIVPITTLISLIVIFVLNRVYN